MGVQVDETGLRRRLRAVLAADASGYSRLMAVDEQHDLNGTMANSLVRLQRLAEARKALIRSFDLSRSIEWRSFEYFGHVYYTRAFKEHRYETAARLLGYATVARSWQWGSLGMSEYGDRHRANLAPHLGSDRLDELIREGEHLEPGAICRLALEMPQPPSVGSPQQC
ncbi:hypothetical protein [Variovorax sp. HW608]|uniref:hypothetical protein n=1 Tax=Variovorax sp. HW608 TaxID=1034889 RepID=UPI000B5AF5C1|nr:hypothetical protein [Variovorax sp. HW608]